MANELVDAVIATAAKRGINPSDLLTVISYETAGTLDPWKRGPTTKWGEHRGLIQWGEPQREKYGITQETPVARQVEAIGEYLTDRGLKPGAGILDLYSTINAGRPGLYNRSDAGAGGAPGTVADKVATQMVGHRMRANQLLGQAGTAAPAAEPISGAPTAPASPAPATALAAAQAPAAEPNITASPTAPAGPSLGGGTLAQMQAVMKMLGAQDQQSALPPPPPIQYPVPPGLARARMLAGAMGNLA